MLQHWRASGAGHPVDGGYLTKDVVGFEYVSGNLCVNASCTPLLYSWRSLFNHIELWKSNVWELLNLRLHDLVHLSSCSNSDE